MSATSSADVTQGDLGFASGYRSTAGLYHFGQRFYDPSLMRWTQPDPLDQTGDLSEGNRYVYVGADPVGTTDPSDLRGARIDASWGPYGVSYGENSTGSDRGESNVSGGTSFGWGTRYGSSGKYYTGEDDDHSISVGVGGCAVVCVGVNSDTGFEFGIGPEVGAGVKFDFDIL